MFLKFLSQWRQKNVTTSVSWSYFFLKNTILWNSPFGLLDNLQQALNRMSYVNLKSIWSHIYRLCLYLCVCKEQTDKGTKGGGSVHSSEKPSSHHTQGQLTSSSTLHFSTAKNGCHFYSYYLWWMRKVNIKSHRLPSSHHRMIAHIKLACNWSERQL